MSDHKKINPLLPFYLAGRLDDQKAAAVESHLAVCSTCMEDLAFWQDLEGAVQSDIRPVKASPRVLDNALSAIRRGEEKANPLVRSWQITLAQIPMFIREIWPTSLLVLLLGFVVTLLVDRAGFLFTIAPLVSVAGLAFIYNQSGDPAFELVLSTPVSQVQLLLARSGMVFGFNLVVVTLLGCGLSLHFSRAVILPLLQGWLAPMTFLSVLGLCLSIFIKPGNAIFISYALWLTRFLPLTDGFQTFFGDLSKGIDWFWQTPQVLYLFSLVFLVLMLFWVLKGIRFNQHLA
jgi:hypothetical protein